MQSAAAHAGAALTHTREMLRSGLYPMPPTQSPSLRLRIWYTRFGTKPAGTSDMLARSSLRCATLAPSSTSTLCLRSLASFTKTFIDIEGAHNMRLLNNAA